MHQLYPLKNPPSDIKKVLSKTKAGLGISDIAIRPGPAYPLFDGVCGNVTIDKGVLNILGIRGRMGPVTLPYIRLLAGDNQVTVTAVPTASLGQQGSDLPEKEVKQGLPTWASNLTADLRVVLEPLQTIDKLLGLVPILGKQARKLTKVHLTVTGPLDDPEVRTVLTKGVAQAIKGTLGIPGAVFKEGKIGTQNSRAGINLGLQ